MTAGEEKLSVGAATSEELGAAAVHRTMGRCGRGRGTPGIRGGIWEEGRRTSGGGAQESGSRARDFERVGMGIFLEVPCGWGYMASHLQHAAFVFALLVVCY